MTLVAGRQERRSPSAPLPEGDGGAGDDVVGQARPPGRRGHRLAGQLTGRPAVDLVDGAGYPLLRKRLREAPALGERA